MSGQIFITSAGSFSDIERNVLIIYKGSTRTLAGLFTSITLKDPLCLCSNV